jgi:hypothetical protein
VVTPVFRNETTLVPLVEQIHAVLADDDHEIVLVDDGSDDGSWAVIEQLAADDPAVHGIRLTKNQGQTQAVLVGLAEARGEVMVLIDADLENDPADIPLLLASIDEGHDFVSGWRTTRRHLQVSRRVPSSIINALMRRWTGVPLHDVGCGLNAATRPLVQEMLGQGERRRHLKAALATSAQRPTEVPVRWIRTDDSSRYGWVDLVSLATDLLGFTTRSFATLITVGIFGLLLGLVLGVGGAALAIAVDPGAGGYTALTGVILSLAGLHFVVTGMVGFYVVRLLHARDSSALAPVATRTT